MTFATELLAITGTAADSYDIKAAVRRCFLYDFDGAPVRLWDGHGRLYAGGQEWVGTYDAAGNNHHKAPAVRDARDGASPKYEFGIPYLDKTTFDALKADQALAAGRDLICYHVLCLAGEGLRPTTAIQFAYRLAMRGTQFEERVTMDGGKTIITRSATVIAKPYEYGRTRTPGGTMTDTAQQERARVLGLSSDSGCSFVSKNSRRTYIINGS